MYIGRFGYKLRWAYQRELRNGRETCRIGKRAPGVRRCQVIRAIPSHSRQRRRITLREMVPTARGRRAETGADRTEHGTEARRVPQALEPSQPSLTRGGNRAAGGP